MNLYFFKDVVVICPADVSVTQQQCFSQRAFTSAPRASSHGLNSQIHARLRSVLTKSVILMISLVGLLWYV